MSGGLSTSAYQAIPEICNEIREFGEPANPALTRILKHAYQTLKTGGAVTGFYGYGKTLIAILSAAAENAAGGRAAVVAAYRALSAEEGKVEINEVAINAVEKLEETCGEDVRRWLGKALGLEPKAPSEALRGRVEIKGRKLNRLLDLVHALKKAGATLIVVDEFEKVVQTPEYYGFKDLGDLLVNFFEMVDRWPRPDAGYTIPSTLWAFLDLQTRRRVAPVYHLSMQITTDDMRKFLERKLGAIPEELKEVNFRNPAVVAEMAVEVKSGGAQAVIGDRFSWLGKIAYSYPKASEKTRRALHAAYISAWYMQNIYAEIPPRPPPQSRGHRPVRRPSRSPLQEAQKAARQDPLRLHADPPRHQPHKGGADLPPEATGARADVRCRPPTPRAGNTMSLKTLHAGARGTWIYQSPRITLLLIYAEAKGLDPRVALQRHLQNVERLGPHQTWILERLQWLGYRTERGGPPT